MSFQPAYLTLSPGELDRRAAQADTALAACNLCARYCGVNRHETIRGAVCHTGAHAVVYRFERCNPGIGMSSVLGDSGAIFFSYCNLRCVYCKKPEVSQKGLGWEARSAELSNMMLALQEKGCHNIHLVNASHLVAQVLGAVRVAAGRGLRLPLVYNSDGYDSPEALALLAGVVDVYMPDIKYGDPQAAEKYSHAADYVTVSQMAVKEMHRQVGDLDLDEQGVARRGLLARHLVLPDNPGSTAQVLGFLANEISRDTHVHLLGAYHPCYHAMDYPALDHDLPGEELALALAAGRKLGLTRIAGV